MTKAIFLTNGDQAFNQLMARYLLGQGHRLTVLFQEGTNAEEFLSQTAEEFPTTLHVMIDSELTSESLQAVFEESVQRMDGLDVLIHGNEMADEEALFELDQIAFGEMIAETFRRIHLIHRTAAGYMVKRKAGSIIFPIFYDALYYAGYPSSPVLNHGKISLMKCLSRELTAFKLSVNVITFGYFDDQFDSQMKKDKKATLEIFGLKPQLLSWEEMIPALDMLVHPPVKGMGGHEYHISAGVETSI